MSVTLALSNFIDVLEKQGYYHDVKKLIEDMFLDYGRKVNILVSSYGGPISHYFLTKYNKIDQTWKDKHIANYFTMSAAWTGGNNIAIARYLTGIDELLINGEVRLSCKQPILNFTASSNGY